MHEPTDYDEWIAMLQSLDKKIRTCAANKKGKSPAFQTPTTRPAQAATAAPAGYSKNPKDSWANRNFHGAAPMDLSAQRRTQERQAVYTQRMQAGVCTRCGDPKKDGHLRAQCQQKTMVLNAVAEAENAPEDSGKE